jgi:hypothetical protein
MFIQLNGCIDITKSTQNWLLWMSPLNSLVAAFSCQVQQLINCLRMDVSKSQCHDEQQFEGQMTSFRAFFRASSMTFRLLLLFPLSNEETVLANEV